MKSAVRTPVTLDEVRERLAHHIRAQRALVGLSQERLALDAGVDRTMLSKIERRLTNPSLDTLLKVANRLGVDVSALIVPVSTPPIEPPATGAGRGIRPGNSTAVVLHERPADESEWPQD